MMRARFLLALVAAGVSVLPAQAQRIEKSFPADKHLDLELHNLGGQVSLRGWDQPSARVVATRHTAAVEVHLEKQGNRLHVHTHLLGADAPASERAVDYEIWAPLSTDLRIRQESGALLIENFTDEVNVVTVAASVTLRRLAGMIDVSTLNGSVEAERCTGRMEVETVSGTLRFLETSNPRLTAKTTSGDIFYQGDLVNGGSYDLSSHGGQIEMLLPATASFELDAHSIRGDVENQFPLVPRSHSDRREFRPLGLLSRVGEALVRATSFSGRIRILRKR